MTLRTHAQAGDSLLHDLWRTKAWRLFPVLLTYITGATLLIPFVPTLMTNYFAGERAGKPLHCEDYPHDDAPLACNDAHGDVVMWSSWTSFASSTVVSVLLIPVLGQWSDRHGRRPFFMLAFLAACMPQGVVLLHVLQGFPLKWYYLVQILTGSVSSITPSLSFLADLLAPPHRAPAFGLILAAFSLAIFVGPAVGALLTPVVAACAALGTTCCCMVYVVVVLPESLTPEARQQAKERQGSGASAAGMMGGVSDAIKILMRSSLFKKLTLCIMLTGMVSEAIQDLLLQYLQIKLGFGVKDQAQVFMTFGACGLVVQTFLLRALLAGFGEQRVLCMGIATSLVQMVVLTFVAAKWQVLAALAVGTLGSMSFPTISSIKSVNAQEHEQGAVQGALYGARALASGVGPLIFAALFKAFSRRDSELPFFPGAPFVLGAVLMVPALAIAASIPTNAGGSAGAVGRQLSWRRMKTFKRGEGLASRGARSAWSSARREGGG